MLSTHVVIPSMWNLFSQHGTLGKLAMILLMLGLAPAASTAASKAQNFVCPVTTSASKLGTEKLSTNCPGLWHTVQRLDPRQVLGDPKLPTIGYRVPKIVWRTNVIDLHEEVHHSSLTITGRRLDAESGPLLYWQANTAW